MPWPTLWSGLALSWTISMRRSLDGKNPANCGDASSENRSFEIVASVRPADWSCWRSDPAKVPVPHPLPSMTEEISLCFLVQAFLFYEVYNRRWAAKCEVLWRRPDRVLSIEMWLPGPFVESGCGGFGGVPGVAWVSESLETTSAALYSGEWNGAGTRTFVDF